MTAESGVMHEHKGHYVMRQRSAYVVFRPNASSTHCESDSAYALTDDGLSCAIARCDYLAQRA